MGTSRSIPGADTVDACVQYTMDLDVAGGVVIVNSNEPDCCTGRTCEMGPHGPEGSIQCRYCGHVPEVLSIQALMDKIRAGDVPTEDFRGTDDARQRQLALYEALLFSDGSSQPRGFVNRTEPREITPEDVAHHFNTGKMRREPDDIDRTDPHRNRPHNNARINTTRQGRKGKYK